MENKNKKNNWFFKILLVLFVAFLCVYSISANGYIQNVNRNKTLYTEEQITKFETDVDNGEYLDLNDYVLADDIDYSNRVSKFGENLSDAISYTAGKTIDALHSFFSYLFE